MLSGRPPSGVNKSDEAQSGCRCGGFRVQLEAALVGNMAVLPAELTPGSDVAAAKDPQGRRRSDLDFPFSQEPAGDLDRSDGAGASARESDKAPYLEPLPRTRTLRMGRAVTSTLTQDPGMRV